MFCVDLECAVPVARGTLDLGKRSWVLTGGSTDGLLQVRAEFSLLAALLVCGVQALAFVCVDLGTRDILRSTFSAAAVSSALVTSHIIVVTKFQIKLLRHSSRSVRQPVSHLLSESRA